MKLTSQTKTKAPLGEAGASQPVRPSAHLCNHVPLVAQLILPHEVGLLKLHFPEDGHVRVDADPEQRRVGTAEGAGEAGETKGRRGDEATGQSPYSMADRSMSTSSPFIRGIFFFLFLGNETSRTSICETVTSPSQEDEERGGLRRGRTVGSWNDRGCRV